MKTEFSTRQTKSGPNMPVKAAPATEFITGQTTVATAGVPVLLHAHHSLESGVFIKALAGNAGDIFLLHSSGSGNGYVLDSGESIFIEIDDLAKVLLNTDSDGDGVSFAAS